MDQNVVKQSRPSKNTHKKTKHNKCVDDKHKEENDSTEHSQQINCLDSFCNDPIFMFYFIQCMCECMSSVLSGTIEAGMS